MAERHSDCGTRQAIAALWVQMLVGLPVDSQYSADRPKWTAFGEDPMEEGTQTKTTGVFALTGMAYIPEENLVHERLSMELDGSLWN